MKFSWIIKTRRTVYNPSFVGEDIENCVYVSNAYDYQVAKNAIAYIASMIKKEGLCSLLVEATDIENFNNTETFYIFKTVSGYSFHFDCKEVFTEKNASKMAKLAYEYALQEIKTRYINNPAMNISA